MILSEAIAELETLKDAYKPEVNLDDMFRTLSTFIIELKKLKLEYGDHEVNLSNAFRIKEGVQPTVKTLLQCAVQKRRGNQRGRVAGKNFFLTMGAVSKLKHARFRTSRRRVASTARP